MVLNLETLILFFPWIGLFTFQNVKTQDFSSYIFKVISSETEGNSCLSFLCKQQDSFFFFFWGFFKLLVLSHFKFVDLFIVFTIKFFLALMFFHVICYILYIMSVLTHLPDNKLLKEREQIFYLLVPRHYVLPSVFWATVLD